MAITERSALPASTIIGAIKARTSAIVTEQERRAGFGEAQDRCSLLHGF
jgi:hypothetical protein